MREQHRAGHDQPREHEATEHPVGNLLQPLDQHVDLRHLEFRAQLIVRQALRDQVDAVRQRPEEICSLAHCAIHGPRVQAAPHPLGHDLGHVLLDGDRRLERRIERARHATQVDEGLGE